MTPTRKSNASQIEVEAQADPIERARGVAREILKQINAKGLESPAGRAYDQLKELIGEGSLLNALVAMQRHTHTAESLLAADKDRKRENKTAINKLDWLTSLLEQREKRAITDARVNAFMDFTFPVGFIRELPDAIAYFEGDNERKPARKVIGLGGRSGGGINSRSKLSIKHASVGRCAEEIRHAARKKGDESVSENGDETVEILIAKSVGILAAMMFDLKDATANNVEKWRQQWVDAVDY